MCARVIIMLAALVVFVSAQGIPTRKCPAGEHSVLYCPQQAEPSCDNPTVHDLDVPGACDIPQCFCNTPTIRDTATGKCVEPSKCPKKC
ncbi:unnamed protein product [Diatraea saccharalis]|uniref:TIL domain-containing protein n=1 Tax=Diatraea saccharalis TaxID=40085 RepID=A0A9N9R4W0_9NEOP|nr:unnamed protein product [Diatraea saccharalis]